MKYLCLFFAVICPGLVWSQEDDGLQFSGYLEGYYSYDFNQPDNHEKPSFINHYHRHNEFNINLAYLQSQYQNKNVRANLGLMLGTFGQKIRKEEPLWAQMVYQANMGVKLSEGFWLDVGIMPSHFGGEGQIGMENVSLSPSILAENTPYYFTGAKLTYEKLKQWEFLLWLTNGWGNIQKKDRFQSLGLGAGVSYYPSNQLKISYNNYLGNEAPQTMKLFRFYNNLWIQYSRGQWGGNIRLDYGLEDHPFSTFNEWWGVMAQLKRSLTESFALGLRGEYFRDDSKVVMMDISRLSGYSINLDYYLTKDAMARMEFKTFYSQGPHFERPAGKLSQSNSAITLVLSITI
ncbi:outer membrane beta-barrel protein [Echinicola jeungdonensis]|uniref:Outer membrane beta-barrel protein n=1 Tax=Echinicola jeungdonensis TaxID=709343 RepID=A0ABV5JA14_9BACT|nr:outer membrane beta-barrel protein [Echinicola jeungdonensis]MDN3669930.1 outer membrane beta-barrel protein [Echinicola jeungdonensis]